MAARQKLNQAYFNGGLVMAAIIGLAFESWSVFFVVAALTVALNLCSGGIRLRSRRP